MNKSLDDVLQMAIDAFSMSASDYENKYYPEAGPTSIINYLTKAKEIISDKEFNLRQLIINIREEDPKYEDMIMNGDEQLFCELAVNGQLENKLTLDESIDLVKLYILNEVLPKALCNKK